MAAGEYTSGSTELRILCGVCGFWVMAEDYGEDDGWCSDCAWDALATEATYESLRWLDDSEEDTF